MRELDDRTLAKLQELLSYAPTYYERSDLYKSLLSASADEAVRLGDALQDVFRQFFVETATWGLGYWEAELGLITNEALSCQARRAVVLQKLRGTGTLTAEKLAAILQSYGPRTSVVEQDPANYRFDAVLVDFLLSPTRPVEDQGENIRDTVAAVRPAHLDFLVQYREFLADAYRDWYKKQYGKSFSQGDERQGIEQDQSLAEPQFGHQGQGSSLLTDTSRTVYERQQEQEEYVFLDERQHAFRANLSSVNSTPTVKLFAPPQSNMLLTASSLSEQAGAFRDEETGFEATSQTVEMPYRFDPSSFRLGQTMLNAPLTAERMDEQRSMVFVWCGSELAEPVEEACDMA